MHQMLTQLKLARVREIHQEWLDRAAESQMPYPDFLRGLLQEELLAREENQVRRRLKDAAFPFEKTLDDFDFRLRPELNRQVSHSCAGESSHRPDPIIQRVIG